MAGDKKPDADAKGIPPQTGPWTRNPETDASGETPNETTRVDYRANWSDLFRMSWRMTVWTILTAGIYRFWLRTALRRHYWSGIRIQGDPLEYTGWGLEKLLGFLLALVILAVVLGLLNIGLTFVGFSLASNDPLQVEIAFQLSVLATLPLIAYAQYRGMRYMLARTRWRGIRFGLESGAWGYAWRATMLSLLTIATLGLAYPYQHFTLAKYITDRSRFGDMKFRQGGDWRALFGHWVWIYPAFLFLPAVYYAIVRYRFAAFKTLWSGKTLHGESSGSMASFDSNLNATWTGFAYIVNATLVAIVALFMIGVTILVGILIPGAIFNFFNDSSTTVRVLGEWLATAAAIPFLISAAVILLVTLATTSALTEVLLGHRILRRLAGSLEISNPQALARSAQRAHDTAAEAGGFADALDVDPGAGF